MAQWWSRLVEWLSGMAAPPAEEAGPGPVDVLGLAVDAVMADAARRNTGRLLILPDTVTLSLPGEEYRAGTGCSPNCAPRSRTGSSPGHAA